VARGSTLPGGQGRNLGGGAMGAFAPPELELDFVFLPTQFYFFHILPPP